MPGLLTMHALSLASFCSTFRTFSIPFVAPRPWTTFSFPIRHAFDAVASAPFNLTAPFRSHQRSFPSQTSAVAGAAPKSSYGALSTGYIVLIAILAGIVACGLIGWGVTGGPRQLAKKVREWMQRQIKGTLVKQTDGADDGGEDKGDEELEVEPPDATHSRSRSYSQLQSQSGSVAPGSAIEMMKLGKGAKARPNVSRGHNTSTTEAPSRPPQLQSALRPFNRPSPPKSRLARSSDSQNDAWWKTHLHHPSSRQNPGDAGGPGTSTPTHLPPRAAKSTVPRVAERVRGGDRPIIDGSLFRPRPRPARVNCQHADADVSPYLPTLAHPHRCLPSIPDESKEMVTKTRALENAGIDERDFASPSNSALAHSYPCQLHQTPVPQPPQPPLRMQNPYGERRESEGRSSKVKKENPHSKRIQELQGLSDDERAEWRNLWWPERAIWSKDLRGWQSPSSLPSSPRWMEAEA